MSKQITIQKEDIISLLDSLPAGYFADREAFENARKECRSALDKVSFLLSIGKQHIQQNKDVCAPIHRHLQDVPGIDIEHWDDPVIIAIRHYIGFQLELRLSIERHPLFNSWLRLLQRENGVMRFGRCSNELACYLRLLRFIENKIREFGAYGGDKDHAWDMLCRFLTEKMEEKFGGNISVHRMEKEKGKSLGSERREQKEKMQKRTPRNDFPHTLAPGPQISRALFSLVGKVVNVEITHQNRDLFRGKNLDGLSCVPFLVSCDRGRVWLSSLEDGFLPKDRVVLKDGNLTEEVAAKLGIV